MSSHFVNYGTLPSGQLVIEVSVLPVHAHINMDNHVGTYLTPEGARTLGELLLKAADEAEAAAMAKMPKFDPFRRDFP